MYNLSHMCISSRCHTTLSQYDELIKQNRIVVEVVTVSVVVKRLVIKEGKSTGTC